jgi:hypothetical protein
VWFNRVTTFYTHGANVDIMTSQGIISLLPPTGDLERRSVLKSLAPAHRYLAEIKGMAATIPNEHTLINTLALQEAKDSSEIENVITLHDNLSRPTCWRITSRIRPPRRSAVTPPLGRSHEIFLNYQGLSASQDRKNKRG